jgi:hypothetical protein
MSVFINEFRYDNTGADVGEAILSSMAKPLRQSLSIPPHVAPAIRYLVRTNHLLMQAKLHVSHNQLPLMPM